MKRNVKSLRFLEKCSLSAEVIFYACAGLLECTTSLIAQI
jgi:hypothetical protein